MDGTRQDKLDERDPVDARLTRILASMQEGYLALDSSGIVTDANPQAMEFLKLRREELISLPIGQIVTAFTGSDLDEAIELVRKVCTPVRLETQALIPQRVAEVHVFINP